MKQRTKISWFVKQFSISTLIFGIVVLCIKLSKDSPPQRNVENRLALRNEEDEAVPVPSTIVSTDHFPPGCKNSWVMSQINDSAKLLVEEINAAWYDDLPKNLEIAYNSIIGMTNIKGEVEEPVMYDPFEIMMPVVDACFSLNRIGNQGDGGKMLCGVDRIADSMEKPCIVYFLSSKTQWEFEESIYDATGCQVHTLGCTMDAIVPERIKDRVQVHNICLGKDEASEPKSLEEVMGMLNHDDVALLRIDMAGYEYDILQQLLSEEDMNLPAQISVSMHSESQNEGLQWSGRQKTVGELALFSSQLYEAGYRVISREGMESHRADFTLARFRCPIGPRTMSQKVKHMKKMDTHHKKRPFELLLKEVASMEQE